MPSTRTAQGEGRARKRELPVLRSSFCCPDVMGGTKLFLYEDGERFLVATRWHNIGRRKRLADAVELFEGTLFGDGLPGHGAGP